MAVATSTSTFYVTLKSSGKTFQINGVVSITITSILLPTGTFRDLPPPAPEAHATDTSGASAVETPDSVKQRDDYTHVALRNRFEPYSILWFTTDRTSPTAAPTKPTSSVHAIAIPATNFASVDVDPFFPLLDVAACTNAPPQGWTAAASR